MSGKNALHIHGFFESIEEVQNFIYDHIYPLPGIEEVSVEFLLKKYKTDIV
jgi:DNA-binding Lrp family transcriptional regulator